MDARERHLEEIKRAEAERARAGYCRRRDLGRYIGRLYRELREYDRLRGGDVRAVKKGQ